MTYTLRNSFFRSPYLLRFKVYKVYPESYDPLKWVYNWYVNLNAIVVLAKMWKNVFTQGV